MSTPEGNMHYAKSENKYYQDSVPKRSVVMDANDLNSRFKNWIQQAGTNTQILYPYAVHVLATIPVIILICHKSVGAYLKAFVITLYFLMIILTLFLYRK